MRTDVLSLAHGQLNLPTFLPDATVGVVRSVDSNDLESCGVQAVVMNIFHLMQRPGSSTVQALGGLHAMAGWHRPIMTDSGGFQAYSLIRENPRYGQLTNQGISFQPDGASRRFNLSPQKTVQLQIGYGADIVVCLDDCTNVEYSHEVQRQAVVRTIDWARKGKKEFERIVAQKRLTKEQQPLLFAVIQGGGDRNLRKWCADALLEIGFDGFAFGGWPLDSKGNLLLDILAYTREVVPERFPMHALGVGHPANVVESSQVGWTLFDSSLPTRDARHGRLYAFNTPPCSSRLAGEWFSLLYIQDKKHVKVERPISPFCDCLCCRNYSMGYLYHLFKVGDCLYQRLATIHNLWFMSQLMSCLRSKPGGDKLDRLGLVRRPLND